MSPDSDLFFPQSDSLLFSEFTNLTEFQELPKDIFLSNAMDDDGGDDSPNSAFVEELHCKDDLKPLLSITDDFSSQLKHHHNFGSRLKNDSVDCDADGQSQAAAVAAADKSHVNPFTLFMDHDPSYTLEFADIASMPADYIKTMESLSNFITAAAPVACSSGQTELLSPRTHAAIKLDSMSLLDELDLNHLNSHEAFTTQPTLQSAHSSAERVANLPPLSPLGKALPRPLSLLNNPTHLSCSSDSISSSLFHINSPPSTSPPKAVRSNSPLYMIFENEDMSNIVEQQSLSSTDMNLYADGSTSRTVQSPKADAVMSAMSTDTMQFLSSNSTIQERLHSTTMHRSRSSHALGQLRTSTNLDSCIDTFSMKPNSSMEMMLSNANNFPPYQASNGQEFVPTMRRVYSTGDLQVTHGVQNFYGSNTENNNTEEGMSLKIGHYTSEERKMKLHRYRQKRNERNFSKKIKYACRKTLADSRPRIRGRFARTDESDDLVSRNNDLPFSNDHRESRYECSMPEATSFVVKRSCTMANKPATRLWRNVEMNVAI